MPCSEWPDRLGHAVRRHRLLSRHSRRRYRRRRERWDERTGVAPGARLLAYNVVAARLDCRGTKGERCLEIWQGDYTAALYDVYRQRSSFNIASVNLSFSTDS